MPTTEELRARLQAGRNETTAAPTAQQLRTRLEGGFGSPGAEQATLGPQPLGGFGAFSGPLETDPVDRSLGARLGRAAQSVERAVTGEGQFSEDLPDINTLLTTPALQEQAPSREEAAQLARISQAVRVPATVTGKVRAIREADPAATFEQDAQGNLIVNTMGRRGFLNRPGASRADLDEVLTLVNTEGPAVAFGTGVGALRGALGRTVGAGAGAAIGSVVRDKAAGGIGSGEDVDLGRAAVAGGAAAGANLAGEAVARVAGRLFRGIQSGRAARAGRLTGEGKRILEEAGFNPADFTPQSLGQFQQSVARAVARGANADEAAAIALARTLPQPVPLSRGQITRNTGQIGEERAAGRGARGELAEAESQQFFASQNEALQANVPQIQSRVGGASAPQVAEAGQGMARIQERLRADREALRGSINRAFDAARDSGPARVPAAEAVQTVSQIKNSLARDGFNDITAPRTAAVVERFRGFGSRENVTEIDIRAFEDLRRQLTQLSRGASDATERTAAGRTIRRLDGEIDALVRSRLLQGDVEAVRRWRQARSLRREMGEKFESDKLVEAIIEAESPQQAMNVIFTANSAGVKKGALGAVRKLKSLLPEPEFNLLKEETFLRLLRRQNTGSVEFVPGDTAMAQFFSGAKFNTELNKLLKDAPLMAREIFTGRDITLLRQFASVAQRISNLPPGSVSTSGTSEVAARLVNMLDRGASSIPFLGPTARDLAVAATRGFRETRAARQAAEAFSSSSRFRSPPPEGFAARAQQAVQNLPGVPGVVPTAGTLGALAGTREEPGPDQLARLLAEPPLPNDAQLGLQAPARQVNRLLGPPRRRDPLADAMVGP